ncbi:MAG: EAL domain-containing protein [Sterolibacterium sp.]|nr:EAL domain-containing protein [Sterolibacterium sp.]
MNTKAQVEFPAPGSPEATLFALSGEQIDPSTFLAFLDLLPIGITLTTHSGDLLACNVALAQSLGITGKDHHLLQDYLGQTEVTPQGAHQPRPFPDWLLGYLGHAADCDRNPPHALLIQLRRPDGLYLYQRVTTRPLSFYPGGVLTLYEEVPTGATLWATPADTLPATAPAPQDTRGMHGTHYDPLTDLPNRTLLDDRISQALALAQRNTTLLAICHLDLDDFAAINEAHGHATGDSLLREIGQRIKNSLRGSDTIARIGGDEFILLLGEIASTREFEQTLERILDVIATPFTVAGQRIVLSASIGVTLAPDDGCDPDPLLRHAGQAMFTAKQEGGGRFHMFDAAKDIEARKQRDIQVRIMHALARTEFRLYYQPKVNMRSGEIISVEALIRWQHPERGLLPPAEFLPQTEGHASDIAIGEWVIAEALRQTCIWAQIGLKLPISVNVSAHHLQHPDFVPYLSTVLESISLEYPDFDPGWLEIEILETTALSDMAYIGKVIDACRELGVGFAIDDFGTGYSSLTYLKRLQAGTLKIDQSFVRDMLDNTDDLAIIEGVIGLASAFQRKVVAEGVESISHGMMLMHLGCDLAQGYGIARPMPASDIPAWISAFVPPASWLESLSYPWDREDFPLFTAHLEHQCWLEQLLTFLKSAPHTGLPGTFALDLESCPFDLWYRNHGAIRFGHMREFSALTPLHEHLHHLAQRLVALKASQQPPLIDDLVPHLQTASQDFLDALQEFRREIINFADMPPTHWSQIRGH